MLAESMLGESGRQIDRDEIHRVHEDNPNEHRQSERRHECAIAVKYGFYLVVDKFEQQFDYRLPPVGNACCCATHDPKKKSKPDNTQRKRCHECIEVQRPERAITQRNSAISQVVTDIFGWR